MYDENTKDWIWDEINENFGRKSGNEIYDLFMQELSAVSSIFDIAELSNVLL